MPNSSSTDLAYASAASLSRRFATRDLSPVDVVEALLERIDAHNDTLCAYITVCRESALAEAKQAESDIAAGRAKGPLHGIPVSVKDICWTEGVRTTGHSMTFFDFVPKEDATHVRRLKDAGMILLGKTNTTEFACGDLHLFGMTPTPWDLTRYSGGSSAGSANGLAAGLCTTAIGTDTGGSIRCPSGFCGITGLKPTFGRVSRHGVMVLSWSMDHVGPMARTAEDCALVLGAMAGWDAKDGTSARQPVADYLSGLNNGVSGLTLGIPRQHYFEPAEGVDPEVLAAAEAAVKQLEKMGARLQPVDLPMAGKLSPAGNVLIMTEAFGQHAERLRTRGDEYGPRARRRMVGGALYTSAEYQQASQVRELWIRDVERVLQAVDSIVTPTLPMPAFPISVQHAGPPDTSWGTRGFNLSGHPAMSLPCGFTSQGLPIGLQIAAKAFDEAMIFRVAHAYQQATDWHTRRPSLPAADPARN